ncbi:DUF2065 domain-containing protein [Hydrogenovibrio kuenenii]|uniref:DUF2065 domain-containing protein n=1 Tax=Hydrogenovibrio kuenenii TaxID=63658 RepID=UPI000465F309|nr:DUF2065 domain-containing protein [Hydrogenovibrio kuenenii]
MLDNILISAIALVFIFEGLMPFVFPHFWQKMMSEAVKMEEKKIRLMGLISLVVGMVILFLMA